jgi:hypothetical protein
MILDNKGNLENELNLENKLNLENRQTRSDVTAVVENRC